MYAFCTIVKWDYKICLMNKLYYHFLIVYVKKTLEKIFLSNSVEYNHTLFLKSCLRDCISIIYNKPTRCNSGSIVFINNYTYALHVSDALCVHHQELYKL